MLNQQVAVVILLAKVVFGGVVDGIKPQEATLECGDTLTLNFTDRRPTVQCSSPCPDVNTTAAGPVFRREARLEEYGLMVRQEYGEDGVVTCSLVDVISDSAELQSSIQAEICTSVIPSTTTTTTSPGGSAVTDSTTSSPEGPIVIDSTTTSPEGPTVTGLTTSSQESPTVTGSTTTSPEGPTVTGSTNTSPEGPTVTGSTNTSPGGPTGVNTSYSTTAELTSTVTVESTTLIECVTTAALATAENVCEPGWSLYESSCFKFNNDKKFAWVEGLSYCNGYDADYAKVTSRVQASFLKALATDDTWIGLNDNNFEGIFIWTDRSQPAFTEWSQGEPNGDGDCTEMSKSNDFWWKDASCAIMKSVLCEKPAMQVAV
ncbi:brevican core protein-like [Scylla paramamosain]|uniref:brevican core protein-like n=1 Tax=Scylla paramamosain TaxID=85552 RepID=UPI003083B0F8